MSRARSRQGGNRRQAATRNGRRSPLRSAGRMVAAASGARPHLSLSATVEPGKDVLRVPWQQSFPTRRREILIPESVSAQHVRAIRSETRATLVASIARGRGWLNELISDPAATTESIPARERAAAYARSISVTQQFNTTTSMGRLTLKVLLSFAQFEREVTSERIRDKIAASKRKGLWVGGMAPLGYDTKDRKITVNEAEAERVRAIFRRYLDLGSLTLLMADLRKRAS